MASYMSVCKKGRLIFRQIFVLIFNVETLTPISQPTIVSGAIEPHSMRMYRCKNEGQKFKIWACLPEEISSCFMQNFVLQVYMKAKPKWAFNLLLTEETHSSLNDSIHSLYLHQGSSELRFLFWFGSIDSTAIVLQASWKLERNLKFAIL